MKREAVVKGYHFILLLGVWFGKQLEGMLVSPLVLMGKNSVLKSTGAVTGAGHVLPQVDNRKTGLVPHPHLSAFLKAFDLC